VAHVVIFGGTSGIGEATARAFLDRGETVTIVGRDPGRLSDALKRLDDAGPTGAGAGAVRAEAADAADAAAVSALAGRLTPIDVLVLAVSGGLGAGAFRELASDDLRTAFEQKFWAQLTALRGLLGVIALGGSVVLVTAGSARAALAGTAGLAAVNGALEAMVAPLAAELAPLRINAVSPGVVDTPWWDGLPADARRATFDRFAGWLPAGRVGRPEEVAAAIVLVATNGYMTGSIIDCAGGGQLAMMR
jgi:NAD(P)-dependent dehydrogenase (short-subunit alcohol dehydrogenase family)